jgi:hypothetical protein
MLRGSNPEPLCSGLIVHFRDFSSSSLKSDNLRSTLTQLCGSWPELSTSETSGMASNPTASQLNQLLSIHPRVWNGVLHQHLSKRLQEPHILSGMCSSFGSR